MQSANACNNIFSTLKESKNRKLASVIYVASCIAMSLNTQLMDPANYELYTCSCCGGILVDPYQLLCGDRICYSCIDRLVISHNYIVSCVRCTSYSYL